MKLVVNAWLLTLTAGLAESIALAGQLGVEPGTFLDVIKGGLMSQARFTRRQVLAGAAATLGALAVGRSAHAKGSVTAAMYPGTWEEAYRAHVVPALKKAL